MRFHHLLRELSVEDFEGSCRRLLRRLDDRGENIELDFQRSGLPASQVSEDLVQRYRREVAVIPRMDRAEETAFCMGVEFLWRRLQKTRRAAGFRKEEVDRYPGTEDPNCTACPPGRERFCMGCAPITLAPKMRARLRARTHEFVSARNELIEQHLYIVFRLLERYRHTGVPIEDLIQEANFSLFKAVRGFDFTRGVRFKTYAGYWVNQAFLTAIYNQSRTVRVPAYIQKAMKKIRDAANGSKHDLNDLEQVSLASGVAKDLVRTAMNGNRYTLSLNKVVNEEGAEMVTLYQGEDEAKPADFAEEVGLNLHLRNALNRLDRREREVLRLRFGLGGSSPRTLAQVGAKLGVSLERVRQIQKGALDKMRSGERAPLLEQYA